MKEKELYTEFQPQQLVYYVEKEDQSFGPIISGSQLSANYLDDFYGKRRNLEQKLRNQIINNEISPVYYYMILQELGPKDLASRLRISQRKLQKLFKPDYFKKISIEKAKHMADIFNIPLANLFQSFVIKDEDRDKIQLQQAKTKNKLYHISKISLV